VASKSCKDFISLIGYDNILADKDDFSCANAEAIKLSSFIAGQMVKSRERQLGLN
jgi:hypothetical protein